ncbi:MAG: hypothetical protein Kow0047_30380 [Anaerolineae bacterium]
MLPYPERYPDLVEAVTATPLYDTHEHLQPESERLALGDRLDFGFLFRAYLTADLVSAGMSASLVEPLTTTALSQDQKWQRVARFWPRVRHTGYGRAIEVTIQEVYGAPGLSEETYRDVSAAMRAHNRPGVHRWLIGEQAGVKRFVLHEVNDDAPMYRESADPSLCHQALPVNRFLYDPIPLEQFAEDTGIQVDSWEGFLATIDWYFERYGQEVVAIKNNCPYWRSLYFEDVPAAEAARAFEKRYVRGEAITPEETKAVQDATFHHCLRQAARLDLPVQIHTGYLAGNQNLDLDRIRPSLLTNLFRQYPDLRFDLFHMGYPFQLEVASLAKNFPNVHVDLCWAWIIDPYATKRALQSFIGTVPINKIFGFGGDVRMADGVYGHSRVARWGIAWALAEMIDEGYLAEHDAVYVARKIMLENAQAFFGS